MTWENLREDIADLFGEFEDERDVDMSAKFISRHMKELEQGRKRCAEWRKRNPKRMAEHKAKYRARNKDKIKEYSKKYYDAHPLAEWRKQNPEAYAKKLERNKERRRRLREQEKRAA